MKTQFKIILKNRYCKFLDIFYILVSLPCKQSPLQHNFFIWCICNIYKTPAAPTLASFPLSWLALFPLFGASSISITNEIQGKLFLWLPLLLLLLLLCPESFVICLPSGHPRGGTIHSIQYYIGGTRVGVEKYFQFQYQSALCRLHLLHFPWRISPLSPQQLRKEAVAETATGSCTLNLTSFCKASPQNPQNPTPTLSEYVHIRLQSSWLTSIIRDWFGFRMRKWSLGLGIGLGLVFPPPAYAVLPNFDPTDTATATDSGIWHFEAKQRNIIN